MSHPSNKITYENIEAMFTYHDEQWKNFHYSEIRDHAKQFAYIIVANTPDCADQAASLRKLREVVMTANAAVALAKAPWSGNL